MKRLCTVLWSYKLLGLGVIINGLFVLSAVQTGWFDLFFSGSALHHGSKGIDFYQVLRGAWAYWHGGSLTGEPLANGDVYAKGPYFVNTNVYHPLLTLALGSLLIPFEPTLAYT